jgi:hypothetical protein
MRKTTLLATLLAFGLFGSCGGSDSDQRAEVEWRVVTVEPDPPGSPQTLRPLTERQRRQSKRIVTGDTRFRRIVGDYRYRLTGTIPLGTQDDRGTQPREVLIGTRSDVILQNPRASVVATWPLVDFEARGEPAYRVTTARLTVRGLRSITAYVDLKRRRLAGLAPGKTDEVVWPPGWPTIREPSGR